MPQELRAQSNDPGAAAHEVLEQVNYTGQPVRMFFTGTIGDRDVRDLTVEVQPGTPADDVVQALREAAHEQR